MMSTHIPYNYLIGWSQHNLWYYGSRTAKGCNPDDLWKTYFTSSKRVAATKKLLGDPDVIQIRKIFINRVDCIRWEMKVLSRLNVAKSRRWYNNGVVCKGFHDGDVIPAGFIPGDSTSILT